MMRVHACLVCVVVLVGAGTCFGTDYVPSAKPVKPVNLTLYRVTPKNITGTIANLNTGDAPGDGFFSTYEMIFPLYCLYEPTDSSCTSRPKLNIPNYNVFEQSTVEVDPRFGIYNGCMPNVTVKNASVCEPYTNAEPGACWWQLSSLDDRNLSALESLCDRSKCYCEALLRESVGAYNKPMAQIMSWHKQTPMWIQMEKISTIWDGTWYSTLSEGECGPDDVVGSGKCFWKFHGVNRRVNATCVKKRLADAIIAHNQPCFDALPNPTNVSAVQWSACLMSGITGVDFHNATAHGPPMSRSTLVNAFESGFVEDGGCPTISAL